MGEIGEFNPKSELPKVFEYVDLESVIGTELCNHRTELKASAPSRAKRLAQKGDLFYQSVRPYQKNNYLFELPNTDYVFSTGYIQIRSKVNGYFLLSYIQKDSFVKDVLERCTGTSYPAINSFDLMKIKLYLPQSLEEQTAIGNFFKQLDDTIALHQRKWHNIRRYIMHEINSNQELFYQYYSRWIHIYKEGAIRKVTMSKYLMTLEWLKKLIPNLLLRDLNRITYQQLLNDYACYHERQTTMDFHHQLKGAILDAVDEGLLPRDPTRKAIIKGRPPRLKKTKYLNQFELHTLITQLNLTKEINWDWFILLIAKTGMRFSEALALTPKDFDFAHQMLTINKTWNYKEGGGFQPTKNRSSVRKIPLDWQTIIQFAELIKNKPEEQPIFVRKKIFNSTVNDILIRRCKKANIPIISLHGLRHTHASLLLFAGVSIASVARRLGHSNMTTTQKTYLHIIQELENRDIDIVMRSLSNLS